MTRDDGITLIDTGYLRPNLCAAYLLHRKDGRAALVDCGTATCAECVLDAIDAAALPATRSTGCWSPTCTSTTPVVPAR